jgi:hypothetical protein
MARPRKFKIVKHDRPKEGSYVRLKTLKEIYKLHGVRHWEEIYDPEIAQPMVDLFGGKVRVIYSRAYSTQFEAEDIRTGDNWNFRNEWIEHNEFKVELIPDELFEI